MTKKCPFCAEEIQPAAVKCKHCGEWLPEGIRNQPLPEVPNRSAPEVDRDETVRAAPMIPDEPLKLRLDRTIITAWVLATWYFVSLRNKQFLSHDVAPIDKWVLFGLIVLNVGVSLQLILLFRGRNRDWQVRTISSRHLSVWGYLWRSVVGVLCTSAAIVGIEAMLSLDPRDVFFTTSELVLWNVPALMILTVVMWLLFSRDYRGQIQLVIRAVRGF